MALRVRLVDGSEDVFESEVNESRPDGYERRPPISRERADFAFRVDHDALIVVRQTAYRTNAGWPDRDGTWSEPEHGERDVAYYRPEQWTSVREE